jgi:hypothetical protein
MPWHGRGSCRNLAETVAQVVSAVGQRQVPAQRVRSRRGTGVL